MRTISSVFYRPTAMAFALLLAVGQVGFAQDDADVGQHMQDGRMALGNQDWAKAAEAFQKAVDADKENAMGWHLLGYALHSDGKLDEAIKMHEKAATFDQVKGIALYNLGCAYSLKKKNKKSLEYLHKAMDAGFNQFDMFESDADLVNVRDASGFKGILRRAKNNGRRMEAKFDPAKMAGKWTVVKGMRAGDEVGEERMAGVITIDKEKITIPAGVDSFIMAYKINADKTPAQIDMEIKGGPAPEGAKALGLIRMRGGQFTLCYDPSGESRPTKFESTADNGYHLFVAKSEKAKAKQEGDKHDDDDHDEDHDEKKGHDKDEDHDDDDDDDDDGDDK